MEWTFCSGTNHPNGNMSGATFADTNVPLVGGAVYHFSVFLDTVTETWDASVSTTIDTVEYSYNSTTDYPDGMGWRDSTINGSYAYFSSRTYHADDVRAFSVDGIKITPEPPPGGRTIVEAHFSGQPEEVDGYPGIPGEGWKSAWEYAVYNDASGEPTVLSDSPLKPGEGSGNYLQVDTTHPYQEDPDVVSYAGARRNYKPFDAPGIDWSKDYTVQFSVRVDENLAGGDFNHVDDRYQFSELDNGYNADTSATWLVSMFGGASDPEAEDPIANAEDVGVWVFYDGGRDREARDAERNVASDIVAITGVVYDFTIEVDPETQSYVATVSDGTDSFTTGTLGWWTSCFEVGGLLVFDTRAGDVVDDFTPEHRIFSLDDVVITQSIEEVPGDTDDDGDVDADDLATLAGNWGASVTPGDVTAGDFDGDGIVGPEDASILAAHWGHGTGEASGTSVPEPCMAMLVGIGLAMLVIRRTRR